MTERARLFVYGSLKRGFANHRVLRNADFLGECRTAPHYRLFDLGAYPALATDGALSITGELYSYPVEHFSELDAFEGPAYRRGTVALSDGSTAEAYLLVTAECDEAIELHTDTWRAR
ncbi:MAG TPA: gamma-glutamylcyclotransferase family protein [Polyangiaceae bacterium]|nr:gamma-glutamylcyclotransferase family protein [Polyangiaceae bacterium]